ncbi:inactive beta-amylase 9-like [Rutidosis leptorrhynchoides]|uniref:inactive beta-amylase 9-like n=1 Tax=Rutidosis leptorrhynchoides TaxID=125765 RepID=UPI003A9A0478
MELSLISRNFCQLGMNHTNNNNNLMIISPSTTKLQMGSLQISKSSNLSVRVSAQSVSHSQSAVPAKASQEHITISNHEDGVKLYVGLPMNSVTECNAINHSRAIAAGLKALKLLGVEGVELPIWWGVAENESIGNYNWLGYLTLVQMIQESGLKLHVSLCFHGSKQDNIPLPSWVLKFGEYEPNIFFSDRAGKRYDECLSFGVDDLPVFDGKTAMQVYKGFIESFKTCFAPYMGSTITGVTIGMGPDGELRYPSHNHQNKSKVGYGAGEFQCYDENMMRNLKQHAENLGNPNWGLGGPHDAPSYNQQPIVDTFFEDNGSWESPYGDFFLSWYSNQLVSHADRMLSLAKSSFSDTTVMVSGKLPLIHSWYKSRSHPSEVTAGFYKTINRNGYEEIAKVFGEHSCRMILPGMDLLDEQQPNELFSSPELLLADITDSCRKHGVGICGQNLRVADNVKSFEQIKKNLVGENGIDLFLYQRMGGDFFSPKTFALFSAFVRSLKQLELDSDDLGVNEQDALFVPGRNRTLQVV